MPLVSEERDVLVTPVTGLQVDQPQAEAVQLEQVVEAAAHEKRGSAAGNADGRGFNPALGIFESYRWHANRQRVGTPALQILLHCGVDRREDLRHRRSFITSPYSSHCSSGVETSTRSSRTSQKIPSFGCAGCRFWCLDEVIRVLSSPQAGRRRCCSGFRGAVSSPALDPSQDTQRTSRGARPALSC